jgi:hypothetical protein
MDKIEATAILVSNIAVTGILRWVDAEKAVIVAQEEDQKQRTSSSV